MGESVASLVSLLEGFPAIVQPGLQLDGRILAAVAQVEGAARRGQELLVQAIQEQFAPRLLLEIAHELFKTRG